MGAHTGATSRYPVDVTSKAADGRGSTGEYRLLYKYLHDRFADRVVLTFSEIESLIGFALPAAAFEVLATRARLSGRGLWSRCEGAR